MSAVTLHQEFDSTMWKGWLVPGYVESSEMLEGRYDPKRPGWLVFDGSKPWKRVSPGPDTLARFLALADGSPRDLLQFARKYGPMGVRRRRIRGGQELVECWENITASERQPDGSLNYFESTHSDGDALGTPLWRTRARRTRHLIDVAQKLHAGGERISYADWREFDQWIIEGRFLVAFKQAHGLKPNQPPTKDQTRQLRAQFESWYRAKKRYQAPDDPWGRLEDAATALIGQNPIDVSMRFSVHKGRLSFSFATCLWDYLAVQTLHAISYGTGTEMVMCSNPDCHEMFKPDHRIPEGKKAWCRKCGTKVAVRFAMRKMRTEAAKKRAAEKARAEHGGQQEVDI